VRFELSLAGTVHAEWDHTSAPVQSGDCTTSERAEGFLTVRFRTRRPTVVRVLAGRLLPVDIHPLDGTATLTGPNTLNELCGETESHAIEPCRRTTRTFRDAKTRLLGTKPGAITFLPVRVTLRRIHCPREPDEVVRSPLGPVPGPLHISTAALANPRIARITLTGSVSRRKTFGPAEHGMLLQRAEWRLTLVRLGP
jgi:hypothetical protein